jgi:hypothetical protein
VSKVLVTEASIIYSTLMSNSLLLLVDKYYRISFLNTGTLQVFLRDGNRLANYKFLGYAIRDNALMVETFAMEVKQSPQ